MRAYSKDSALVSSRRAHIAECASRVFIKKGFEAANIPDIAEACNMSVGSLYRYVGSKEDILYLVINHGIQRETNFARKTFEKAKSMDPISAIKLAISDLIKSIDEIQDIILLSYRTMYNIEPAARQNVLNVDRSIINSLEKLLIIGCKKGVFEIDSVHMVAQTIDVIANMWVLRRWAFRNLYTLNEYIDINTNNILKMICKDPCKPT